MYDHERSRKDVAVDHVAVAIGALVYGGCGSGAPIGFAVSLGIFPSP